jgi:hypothetical protein
MVELELVGMRLGLGYMDSLDLQARALIEKIEGDG